MKKRYFFAAITFNIAIVMLLFILAAHFPSLAKEFHLPIAILANAALITILISCTVFILMMLWRTWQSSSTSIRCLGVILFAAGILSIEIYERKDGEQPGWTAHSAAVIPLEKLVDSHRFIADSFGVTRFNPAISDAAMPTLNEQGFHSRHAFTQQCIDSLQKAGRKTIFVIGDSYTQGAFVRSGESFADRLDNTGGLAVLNAGIGGTDLEQYNAVVNEYIATGSLKPSMVLICVCGANDLSPRPYGSVLRNIPRLFWTNAGCLESVQGSYVCPTAQEAYERQIKQMTIEGIMGKNWFTKVVGAMYVTSKLIGTLYQITHLGFLLFDERIYTEILIAINPQNAIAEIEPYINHIKAVCQSQSIPVLFVLIPGHMMVSNKHIPHLPGIISLDPYPFRAEDYPPEYADHPNSEGHRKIFIQLINILNNPL
jgi:hypothetical protein